MKVKSVIVFSIIVCIIITITLINSHSIPSPYSAEIKRSLQKPTFNISHFQSMHHYNKWKSKVAENYKKPLTISFGRNDLWYKPPLFDQPFPDCPIHCTWNQRIPSDIYIVDNYLGGLVSLPGHRALLYQEAEDNWPDFFRPDYHEKKNWLLNFRFVGDRSADIPVSYVEGDVCQWFNRIEIEQHFDKVDALRNDKTNPLVLNLYSNCRGDRVTVTDKLITAGLRLASLGKCNHNMELQDAFPQCLGLVEFKDYNNPLEKFCLLGQVKFNLVIEGSTLTTDRLFNREAYAHF